VKYTLQSKKVFSVKQFVFRQMSGTKCYFYNYKLFRIIWFRLIWYLF